MTQVNPFRNPNAKVRDTAAAQVDEGSHCEGEGRYLTLADFDRADDYVLYCRQSGIEPEVRFGRHAFAALSGVGENVALHRAIHGCDEEV